MSDEQFRQMCNVYGFAPSRALREMMDAVAGQAVIAEREACACVVQKFSAEADAAWREDEYTEKAMRSGLMAMISTVTEACAAEIRNRGRQ